jgi:ankyrin repeat protein
MPGTMMHRWRNAFLTALLLAVPTVGLAIGGPLVDAASENDVAAVRNLLREGADVSEAHGDGMTALHWAAEIGNAEIADMLIFAGSNLEAGTRIGHYTPLHIASRRGHADVVAALVDAGADVTATTTNSGATPLHLAAASGSAAATAALVAADADVEAREDRWGQTPLVFAAAANRVDVIDVLVDAGADPSASSAYVDTAIMEEADRAADRRVTEFLAEFKEKEGGGPNWQPSPSQVQAAIEAAREIQRKWPNVPDPSCDDYVASEDGEDPTKNKCAGAVTYNADGVPVFDYSEDESNSASRPPSYGQRVNRWGGLTPLLHAIRQGHEEATMRLLDHGADINQVSAGDGTSPLLMATVNGHFDLALALLERDADPTIASLAGTTPLFAVIERRWASKSSYSHPTEHQQQAASHYDVMRALLDAGADPNARLDTHLWFAEYTFSVIGNQSAGLHYKGATPFWRAALALDVEAMRMLKAHGADPHIATIKLPERRRRRPPPAVAEIKEGDAKKTVTGSIAEPAVASAPKDGDASDPSGLPPVPVGGPFVSPVHVVAGAGYGQSWAANAHIHAPDAWMKSIRFLVEECGADVNLRDARGYTSLHHAASRGDTAAVQYLIDRGADVMVVSRKGETTVDMANSPYERIPPYPETIALLESYGAINNHNCVSC